MPHLSKWLNFAIRDLINVWTRQRNKKLQNVHVGYKLCVTGGHQIYYDKPQYFHRQWLVQLEAHRQHSWSADDRYSAWRPYRWHVGCLWFYHWRLRILCWHLLLLQIVYLAVGCLVTIFNLTWPNRKAYYNMDEHWLIWRQQCQARSLRNLEPRPMHHRVQRQHYPSTNLWCSSWHQ